MTAPQDAVVGRDAELAAIDEFLGRDEPRALLLEGEAGVPRCDRLLTVR